MAEVPTIPAAPPSPVVSSNAQTIPTTATSVQPPQLQEIPVQQVPSNLTITELPDRLEGRVIATNAQTQEVRIQTDAGEVTVKTQAQLLPDTPVTLKIYINKNQMLADILIQQQASVEPQQIKQNIAPPPLKEGQSVIALILPEPIKQIKTQTPVPEKDIQQALQKQSASDKPTTENAAIKTPQASSPDTIRRVLSAYLPQIFGSPAKTDTPSDSETADILDNNLMLIMRAQTHAKAAQNTPQLTSSPAPVDILKPVATALPNALGTLLSLISNTPTSQQENFTPLMPVKADVAPAPLPDLREMAVLKILPPHTSPEQIKAAMIKFAGQNVQAAEIESSTSGGYPILKTKDNHFVLKAPAQIATGSVVLFKSSSLTPEQILSLQQPQTHGIKAEGKETTALFDPLRSTVWTALDDTVKTLQQIDPAAGQTLRHTLPVPTERLASTALFFLAALRFGSIETWLGSNTLKALQDAGKKDLVSRLTGDFTKISDQSKQPLADEWKAISIPLLHDEQISQIQFFIRQHPEHESKDQGGKPATRFILNLQLSQMGDMQLDGFIHQKKFDMVLRSEENLPFTIRQELMKRFAQGLEQVHMQGGISFQVKQQSWVNIELPYQTGVTA